VLGREVTNHLYNISDLNFSFLEIPLSFFAAWIVVRLAEQDLPNWIPFTRYDIGRLGCGD